MKGFLIFLACVYGLDFLCYLYDLMEKSFPVVKRRSYGDYCAGAIISSCLAMSCLFFVAINP